MSQQVVAAPRPAMPPAPVAVPRFGLLDLLSGLGVLAALYFAFIASPAERVQGNVFRILYVHVSMAWLAYASFTVVLVASVAYLWRRGRRADEIARASAEIGVVFTTLTLITGSLWGRPVWGVWWTWDARLTTTLVLWFIYVGYLMVRSAVDDPERGSRIAAVVGVVGFVGVVLNYFSVELWRTLHPEPTVTRSGGMTGEMVLALCIALLAFSIVFVRLLVLRVQLIRAQASVRELAQQIAERTEV